MQGLCKAMPCHRCFLASSLTASSNSLQTSSDQILHTYQESNCALLYFTLLYSPRSPLLAPPCGQRAPNSAWDLPHKLTPMRLQVEHVTVGQPAKRCWRGTQKPHSPNCHMLASTLTIQSQWFVVYACMRNKANESQTEMHWSECKAWLVVEGPWPLAVLM